MIPALFGWLLTACTDAPPSDGGGPTSDTTPTTSTATTTTPSLDSTTPPTTTTPVVEPIDSCDAGDEAWVQRAMPLLWGRRAHGSAEVQLWAAMAREHGRDTIVRAMTHDPLYLRWWRQWLADALYVARTGDKAFDECFQSPLLPEHDGALAIHIRDNPPQGSPYSAPYNMADVLLDSLALDDVSVAYKAHIFARMQKPVLGANVSAEELEFNRRVNFGELFFNTYLGRNTTCIACHNSEWSVTDDPDPALDRTWQIKGLFELAVLGASDGQDVDEHFSMFRYQPLVPGTAQVWGMDAACGTFNNPSTFGPDFLGQETSFFIEATDSTGSVWNLVEDFDAGVDLVANGLYVNGDATVDGQEAFAYLVAAHVADLVWEQAIGERLTIAHGFARNEGQVDVLKRLADTFAESRFSLRELLVAVTAEPAFNAGGPTVCESDPYGLEPIVNPWSVFELDPAIQGNGVGDIVHRQTARVLLRTAYDQLDWGPPPEWSPGNDDEDLLAAMGAFLRESEPGFNGSDFQGALAFEERFGSCKNPGTRPDFIDRLVDDALATGATVGDVVGALKDRLVSSDSVEPDESLLIEDLLSHGLSTPLAETTDEFLPRLRILCGTVLLSPDWHLAVDPATPGAVPAIGADPATDCWDMSVRLAEEGVTVDCEGFAFLP